MVKMEIKRDTGNKIQFEKGRSEKVETIVKEKVFKKAQSPSHSYDGYNNTWSERRESWMNIRMKLLLGYMILVVLILVIGLIGLNSFKSLNEVREYSQKMTVPALSILEKISTNSESMQKYILRADLNVEDAKESYSTAREDLLSLINAYESLTFVKGKDQKYLAWEEMQNMMLDFVSQMKTSMEIYDRIAEEVFPLYKNNAPEYEIIEKIGELDAKFVHFAEILEKAKKMELAGSVRENEKIADHDARILGRLMMLSVISIILALLIAFYLSNSISRPINYLKDMTAEIGKGNLDLNIHVKTGDELEDLASSFNQMAKDLKVGREQIVQNNEELTATNEELQTTAEELKSSNEEMQATNEELKETTSELEKAKQLLESHKAQLETKVEKRTKELSTKNVDLLRVTEKLTSNNEEMQATNEELKETTQRLEEAKREAESAKLGLEKQVQDRTKQLESSKQDLKQQVEERTAELQTKVDQLEKFSNVATEREMKMISLKNKIKELEEKLGHSESEEEEIDS